MKKYNKNFRTMIRPSTWRRNLRKSPENLQKFHHRRREISLKSRWRRNLRISRENLQGTGLAPITGEISVEFRWRRNLRKSRENLSKLGPNILPNRYPRNIGRFTAETILNFSFLPPRPKFPIQILYYFIYI